MRASRKHNNISISKRYFLLASGHVSMVIAVIGIILPIMPATPFILIAAYCYSQSSRRFYCFLLSNKYFGRSVRNWERSRCIAASLKLKAQITLILMFGITILFVIQDTQFRIGVGLFALVAIGSLACVPSCNKK